MTADATTGTTTSRLKDALRALSATPGHLLDYTRDSAERAVLFADIMRQRGDQHFEHVKAGQPPVLRYDYEVLIDGARLERPVNYALLRITPPEGVVIDAALRPYVIIDPRAGHGPGIGGFKAASQVGVALGKGHPVYFVMFRPEPEPGQTLTDVANAEAHFIRHVRALHPEAPCPCIIGNCQAGWAVAMLAALEPELSGPIVLNGAPMSYWSGVDGKNPMRYLGGLLGGTWITSLMADLGGGRFDGAYLVQNFENLNPGNTLFDKQYHVWRNVDTEGPRYLEFERWWNGFFLMNTEEMEFIVDNLFIGNRLAAGQVVMDDGRQVTLRDIKAPIVIFASGGDNITPPQQALNWICDVYPTDEDILHDQQTIVYTLHEDIGHLGIFVSSRVARREHTAIIESMEVIDALPPGLYELVIEALDEAPADDPGQPSYEVRFIERSIRDIQALDDGREEEAGFAALAAISDFNAKLYRTLGRPVVRALTPKPVASLGRALMPLRAQHYALSSRNPAMWPVRKLAERVRANRHPISPENPLLAVEQLAARATVERLNAFGTIRDDTVRQLFQLIYGPMGLGALFPDHDEARPTAALSPEAQDELDALIAHLAGAIDAGGFAEGLIRALLVLSRADRDVEPRTYVLLRRLIAEDPRLQHLSWDDLRHLLREQHLLLRLHRDAALAALPKLLPDAEARAEVIEIITETILHGDRPNRAEAAALDQLRALLEITE